MTDNGYLFTINEIEEDDEKQLDSNEDKLFINENSFILDSIASTELEKELFKEDPILASRCFEKTDSDRSMKLVDDDATVNSALSDCYSSTEIGDIEDDDESFLSTAFLELELKNIETERALDQLEEKLSILNGDNQNLHEFKHRTENNCATYEEQITDLYRQSNESRAEVQILQDKHSALQNANLELNEKIQNILTTQERKRVDTDLLFTQLKDQINLLTNQNQDLQKNYNKLLIESDKKTSLFEKRKMQMKQRYEKYAQQHSRKKQELHGRNKKLQSEVKYLKETINSLQSLNFELISKLSNEENQRAAAEKKCTKIESEYQELQGIYDELKKNFEQYTEIVKQEREELISSPAKNNSKA